VEKKMRALFLSGAMVAGVAPALAQPSFTALDRNGDGSISRIEALADAEIRKRFAAFDRDRDGRLSRLEYRHAAEDNNQRIQHDLAITERVRQALLAEKGIPSRQIAVETYEGQVHLKGFVGAPAIASRAGRVTAAVDGVRTVHNDLAVK
jgi:hyperosmotically inducible protein